MDENILEWLLAEDTPEVRLRTLKEYLKLSDGDCLKCYAANLIY